MRGVYEKELTEDIARRVGAAFGSYLRGGRITLGRDTRLSGPSLEQAFLEGLITTGCTAESYGIVPISLLSYRTWRSGNDAAAYISASHNPSEYNGIRFRTSEGYGMLYHETGMMDIYEGGNFIEGNGHKIDCNPTEIIENYGNYVAEKLDLKRSLKIVLDMGNGSACGMETLYHNLNFNCVVVNGAYDGLFSGRGPSPTNESLGQAAELVVNSGADYGVGFDPDADRGLVIDERGRIVSPEKVAIILAKQRYGPGDTVVAGFDCSMIVENQLEPMGIKVIRERVGDVYVANRVKNEGAVLGVERSAHFFLSEFQYSDDPFAMSLALGEAISEGQKLSEMADQIPDYPYIQQSIRIDGDPVAVMIRLKDVLYPMEPDTTDGLKVTTETYSVLIRPSNTEPLIRLYIESAENDITSLAEKFEGLIKDAIR